MVAIGRRRPKLPEYIVNVNEGEPFDPLVSFACIN
jgi:hypothetical protein